MLVILHITGGVDFLGKGIAFASQFALAENSDQDFQPSDFPDFLHHQTVSSLVLNLG